MSYQGLSQENNILFAIPPIRLDHVEEYFKAQLIEKARAISLLGLSMTKIWYVYICLLKIEFILEL